jgi:glycosyltransferase involved in cell wall biosynthesis
MNIAVFSHYFSPEIGAPSARIHDMARQWIAMGHEVQVVTCFPNHPTGQIYPGYTSARYATEAIDGITVHRNWTYITPNKGFIKKTLGHVSFWPSSRLFSLPRMTRPDAVIGTSPTFFAAMSAAAAGRRFRVPYVMEVRDLWPACFVDLGVIRNRRIIRLLERWELHLYRKANHIVTVTDAFKQDLVQRGVPDAKVTSIPNGADEDFWTPQPRSGFLDRVAGGSRGFNVLYIGAHGISQALTRILEAAKLLRDEPGIRFFLVGEGAEKAKLQATAREMNLTQVHFLEPVDKQGVRDCYADADACLVPLRDIPLFKTFIPSKMFEMLAMGRPIVASLCGEAADILNASGGALVVPPEDSTAIAAAIRRLCGNPAIVPEMGARGRDYVIRHYSRRALAARYVKTLQSTSIHRP